MKMKTISALAALSATLLSANAMAFNTDSNGNGKFESKGSPNGSVINLDASTFPGSDYYSWTVASAPAVVNNSRMLQITGLNGATSIDFTWTTGGAPAIGYMYDNFTVGEWEHPTDLQPLMDLADYPPVVGGWVRVNGQDVLMGEVTTIAVTEGAVITLEQGWTGDNTPPTAPLIHGVFGIELVEPTAVPVPAAAWLFGSALLGLVGVGRKRGVAN